MRVGLLADVHGNADALAAVLAAARAHGVDRWLCCGDLVGYYYDPARCLHLLEAWDVEYVRGNHEDMLIRLLNEPALDEEIRQKYGSGLRVAADSLSPAQIEWLAELPSRKSVEIDGRVFLLCHGAPWDTNEYVYPDSASLFERCAEAGADYVVMGHTHRAMAHRLGATLLLNPGSVGQPRRGGPGAQWAMCDMETGAYEHRAEPYDRDAVTSRAKALDPHYPFLWEVFERP